MTPQKKAKELISKFGNVQIMFESQIGNIKYDEQSKASKQCALIAVDEAEKSEYNVLMKFGFVTENYKSDYWQEVKTEIEKL